MFDLLTRVACPVAKFQFRLRHLLLRFDFRFLLVPFLFSDMQILVSACLELASCVNIYK